MNNHPSIREGFKSLLDRILEPMTDDELLIYYDDLEKLGKAVFNDSLAIEITQAEIDALLRKDDE